MKKIIAVCYAPAWTAGPESSSDDKRIILINNIEELPSLEGYSTVLVDGYMAMNRNLMLDVLHAADAVGAEIACKLPPVDFVLQERNFFRQVLTDYVDAVYASEDAALAYAFGGGDLTGISDPALTAAAILARTCREAIVKLNAGGIICHNDDEENKLAHFFNL